MEIYQILVKLLDGKTKPIQFTTPTITGDALKRHLSILTKIPSDHHLLTSGGHIITDETLIHHSTSTIHLLLRLRGGKGGFGSLLRGAATKAGQKKTNNFDACRDMSGRRLRHVNAEKKLEEWRAEAEARELERMAEEFMKKKAKESKGSKGSGKTEKYIQKYREDSAKCVEEVEASVRVSMGMYANLTKKKKLDAAASESDAKRFKIWMGKKKVEESDSDEEDENDAEKRIVTSIVLDEGNRQDHSKTTEGTSASIANGKLSDLSGGGSLEHSSVKEKENIEESNVVKPALEILEDSKVQSMPVSVSEMGCDVMENPNETASENSEELVGQASSTSSLGNGGDSEGGEIGAKENKFSECKSVVGEEIVVAKTGDEDIGKPLNFDEFNSAADMEGLGMERLKSELQTMGLKCGGTLQERAARLFLLKTTPLDKLPKKLLAKK